ncbi:MAG TPA: AtpZ/AtpI family protein [Thermodesulfobacteriota bacterium]
MTRRRPSVPETIGRKARRKRRARLAGRRGVWFGLGMFGLVGWSVAVPTLVGIALGVWLDRRFPGPISWTLAGLLGGVALGCLNAWYWVTRESRDD